MSGLIGVVSFKRSVDKFQSDAEKMLKAIKPRGKEGTKISFGDHAIIGASNFYKIKGEQTAQPLAFFLNQTEYTIGFDGQIYNRHDLKDELEKRGHEFETDSDAEIALKAYVQWGAGALNRFSGVYAFVIFNKQENELFLARDRFGIKPLYYTVFDDVLAFASEIKGLLAHKDIKPILDLSAISELIGLGPAHEGGSGILKDIYEIKPAHCATFNKDGFSEHKYWELESKEHTDDFDTTVEKTRELILNAINSQLTAPEDLCCFLSGGVDSSSIVSLASRKLGSVKTFSLEYEGNDKYFKPNDFQPNSDKEFIQKVVDEFQTEHEIVHITTKELVEQLEEAALIRDQPGMGDVDSSLLHICKKLTSKYHIATSGECGDEVFGGYPWFHRKDESDNVMFPWAKNLEFRQNLLSSELLKSINIIKYIEEKYEKTKASLVKTPFESSKERKLREMSGVTFAWFMYTLGERSERIGMSQALEIRMPYCDHKLVEYVWNVPWKFKAYEGREKGLMRKALEGLLPKEVLWRKKSPFPKTHNPEFEELVKTRAKEILDDPTSLSLKVINKNFILETMKQPSDYGKPWFGQLMATPQLYAYIIQLEAWLRHYGVKIEV